MNEITRGEKKRYVFPNGAALFTCTRTVKVYCHDRIKPIRKRTSRTVQFIGEPLLTSRMKTRPACLETPARRQGIGRGIASTLNQPGPSNSYPLNTMLALRLPLGYRFDQRVFREFPEIRFNSRLDTFAAFWIHLSFRTVSYANKNCHTYLYLLYAFNRN